MSTPSFFFYDYETTGIDPKYDRIIQFAGIRTDSDFNLIEDPICIYCKLPKEIIPNIEALLVTQIDPDILNKKGLEERKFINIIAREFSRPNTCVLGYNTIRFDDEFTRYGFYRNFIDPYAREWQNGNTRWDLIDLVRMCSSLRPESLEWPYEIDDSGNKKISYKLENLTKTNKLDHYKAHDALSDVYATIEIAKLIKNNQPKLFNYLYKNRSKNSINKLFDFDNINNNIFNKNIDINKKLLVHSSGMINSEYYATSVFLPIYKDNYNKNNIISWDLRYDPEILLSLNNNTEYNIDYAKKLLYTSSEELAKEGLNRLNLKNIILNKSPALAPINVLDQNCYDRINLDYNIIITNANKIIASTNKDKWMAVLKEVFNSNNYAINNNLDDINNKYEPDGLLYNNFITNSDRSLCNRVILLDNNNKLKEIENLFQDKRLSELMFRYRARYFYDELNNAEQNKWELFIKSRLENNDNIYSTSLLEFYNKANNYKDNDLVQKWVCYFKSLYDFDIYL